MHRTLKDFRDNPPSSEDELSERDIQVATVAILCELAHADKDFETEEINEIVRSMNREFDLTDVQIGELLEIAEFLRKNQKSLEDYLAMVATKFDVDQRTNLLRILWQVIGSDNVAESIETSLAVVIRKRLHLTMEQAVRARMLAKQPLSPEARRAATTEEENG